MPEEITWLLAQPHKQLALGQALTSILAAADIDPMAKSRLDGMLTLYIFEVRGCVFGWSACLQSSVFVIGAQRRCFLVALCTASQLSTVLAAQLSLPFAPCLLSCSCSLAPVEGSIIRQYPQLTQGPVTPWHAGLFFPRQIALQRLTRASSMCCLSERQAIQYWLQH